MRSVSLAVALALVAAAASAAETPAQRSRKPRRAGQGVDQELQGQPPAGLVEPSASLARRRAVQEPPATPATPAVAPQAAGTIATPGTDVTNREGTAARIVRGARRAGILPKVVPPYPGPASPIR